MDFNVTFRKAVLFELHPKAAARMRIRYLNEQIHETLSMSKHPIALLWCNQMMEEILKVTHRANKPARTNGKDSVTDQDIESAKMYPVSELIEFKNGGALAWCHNDRKPSLFYASRVNRAICPVCDKKFNPIDILMERDGMTFLDAVKQLRS